MQQIYVKRKRKVFYKFKFLETNFGEHSLKGCLETINKGEDKDDENFYTYKFKGYLLQKKIIKNM